MMKTKINVVEIKFIFVIMTKLTQIRVSFANEKNTTTTVWRTDDDNC